MSDVRTPTLAQLLNDVRTSTFADLRVSLPGKVESYDASTQTVDVTPLVRDTLEEADGTLTYLDLPVIPNVPLMFPGAGGFRITFPVSAGDNVLLVFADRSIDAWQSGGGVTNPADGRTHDLTDCVAIPGLHPNNAPWNEADTSVVTLGSDSGASEFVATAQRVLTELQKIQTTFNAHVHPVTAAPGTSGPPATPLSGLQAPASSTVKIKG